jgi:hypothetical protein
MENLHKNAGQCGTDKVNDDRTHSEDPFWICDCDSSWPNKRHVNSLYPDGHLPLDTSSLPLHRTFHAQGMSFSHMVMVPLRTPARPKLCRGASELLLARDSNNRTCSSVATLQSFFWLVTYRRTGLDRTASCSHSHCESIDCCSRLKDEKLHPRAGEITLTWLLSNGLVNLPCW